MISRFSSRRQRLDRSFLAARLQGAQAYDRIAGYFSSSLLEVAGEAIDSVSGKVRVVCNSDLDPHDVEIARAAALSSLHQEWCASQPEALLQGVGEAGARERFRRLYQLLRSGKLEVRVLPEQVFGLIHGKAGVITLANGQQTSFMGSTNESRSAWQLNYELLWEDASAAAVAWVQEEFDALWYSPYGVPLAYAVIEDIGRLAERRLLLRVEEWQAQRTEDETLNPAPAPVETPVYRKENGLWAHQKYFVKLVIDSHNGPTGRARFVLADQVGLGKTVQLAMAAQLIALTGSKPILIICPKTLLWQWQREMFDLLDMPSAAGNGRQWVDEQAIEYPVLGSAGIRQCPRRVGVLSAELISHGSEAGSHLLSLDYDCVILDEAHCARRRNLGEKRDHEAAEPNNLLRFMYQIASRTRSLLLATATPVQLRPIEAWDLLDVLSRGDDSVLGNRFSRWRQAESALALLLAVTQRPENETEQYRDSILWLAEQLSAELPDERIAIYSGPTTSGIRLGLQWTPTLGETIKEMVRRGELRLLLGTDAASEVLNLQRLARLINLDLPWNPTRLEQRKGRIQRIGQIHNRVQIYNLRYQDSVEDRVHQLLSERLQNIHSLFGQIPDTLEDVWVHVALGEQEQAQKIINELPKQHPFELRYTRVESIDWESCSVVLDPVEKRRLLRNGW